MTDTPQDDGAVQDDGGVPDPVTHDDKAGVRHQIDFSDAEWIPSTDDGSPGVEVAFVDGYIGMRSSEQEESPILVFTPEEWFAFVEGAKDGEFDEA